MKLDIDLNELSLEELETIVKLAKKQETKEEEEIKVMPIRKVKEISVEEKYKGKISKARKGIIDDRAKEVKKLILEKGVVSGKELEKYGQGGSLWKLQRKLKTMHGISFAKIGWTTYYFRKGYDIQSLAEKGTKVSIKGKKPFNKTSKMWAFKSKRLKELLATQPHSTLEQKSKIMKQLSEDYKNFKKGTKESINEEKGFDYSKILADNPKALRDILERQLKISKTVNYRDVSSIIPQTVWIYDTVTQILKNGDEIVKDLGLNGKIIGTELGRINLR